MARGKILDVVLQRHGTYISAHLDGDTSDGVCTHAARGSTVPIALEIFLCYDKSF